MLFRRRERPTLYERVRIALWPRRSWARSGLYFLYRLRRLSGSPHAIALGCAAGVFISFTPFLGFQFLLAAMLAWMLGGSIIASAFGTLIGNPLSFPLIWISTYKIGCLMIRNDAIAACSFGQGFDIEAWGRDFFEQLMRFSIEATIMAFQGVWPVIKPMVFGSLPLGAAAAVITYFTARRAVQAYQQRRWARRLAFRRRLNVLPGPGAPIGQFGTHL